MSRRSYSEVASRKKRVSSKERIKETEQEGTYEIVLSQPSQPFFPRYTSSSFRFSNISLFSSGSVEQSIYTANLLGSFFFTDDLSRLTITDATSCIGGNTWAFSTVFGRVNAVELDPLHYRMLQHNLQQLGLLHKVNAYLENYLNLISSLTQDIVFLDPPWGGLTYRTNPRVGLHMDDGTFISIKEILQLIPLSTLLIMIKVPKNYSTYGLQKEGYPVKKVISLKSEGGIILYKLVILSRISSKRKVIMPLFSRIRYKTFTFVRKHE